MALDDWQVETYLDSFDVLRGRSDANGDPDGYYIVSVSNPCNYIRTPNFDVATDPVVSKEDNIFTANTVRCGHGIDVQAQDVVHMTDRRGNVEWQAVKGAPQVRSLLGYMTFYVVICGPPPDIAI